MVVLVVSLELWGGSCAITGSNVPRNALWSNSIAHVPVGKWFGTLIREKRERMESISIKSRWFLSKAVNLVWFWPFLFKF